MIGCYINLPPSPQVRPRKRKTHALSNASPGPVPMFSCMLRRPACSELSDGLG